MATARLTTSVAAAFTCAGALLLRPCVPPWVLLSSFTVLSSLAPCPPVLFLCPCRHHLRRFTPPCPLLLVYSLLSLLLLLLHLSSPPALLLLLASPPPLQLIVCSPSPPLLVLFSPFYPPSFLEFPFLCSSVCPPHTLLMLCSLSPPAQFLTSSTIPAHPSPPLPCS